MDKTLTPTYIRAAAFILGCVAAATWFGTSSDAVLVPVVMGPSAWWLVKWAQRIERTRVEV